MTAGYPVMLRLVGRRCVVVGGGFVATRKVGTLVASGAQVVVVAPTIGPEIVRLAGRGTVKIERREFVPPDLDGAFLAFAATDDRRVNSAVAEAATERGVLVNVADDPSASDISNLSQVRRRDITVAISTGGRSPAFARFLREQLDEWLTDARFDLFELIAEVRGDFRLAGESFDAERWRRVLADVSVIASVERGDRDSARRRILAVLSSRE